MWSQMVDHNDGRAQALVEKLRLQRVVQEEFDRIEATMSMVRDAPRNRGRGIEGVRRAGRGRGGASTAYARASGCPLLELARCLARACPCLQDDVLKFRKASMLQLAFEDGQIQTSFGPTVQEYRNRLQHVDLPTPKDKALTHAHVPSL